MFIHKLSRLLAPQSKGATLPPCRLCACPRADPASLLPIATVNSLRRLGLPVSFPSPALLQQVQKCLQTLGPQTYRVFHRAILQLVQTSCSKSGLFSQRVWLNKTFL